MVHPSMRVQPKWVSAMLCNVFYSSTCLFIHRTTNKLHLKREKRFTYVSLNKNTNQSKAQRFDQSTYSLVPQFQSHESVSQATTKGHIPYKRDMALVNSGCRHGKIKKKANKSELITINFSVSQNQADLRLYSTKMILTKLSTSGILVWLDIAQKAADHSW